jgi:hypothetical protein
MARRTAMALSGVRPVTQRCAPARHNSIAAAKPMPEVPRRQLPSAPQAYESSHPARAYTLKWIQTGGGQFQRMQQAPEGSGPMTSGQTNRRAAVPRSPILQRVADIGQLSGQKPQRQMPGNLILASAWSVRRKDMTSSRLTVQCAAASPAFVRLRPGASPPTLPQLRH